MRGRRDCAALSHPRLREHRASTLTPLLPATWLAPLLVLAGAGQIALVLGSSAIPRQLGWRAKLSATTPLIRQMFWVYAAYILATNLAFGLLSALAPAVLLDGSPLATAVCGFICLYWVSRVIVQWTYFDLSELPISPFNKFARIALETLFIALALVYGAATLHNLTGSHAPAEAHARLHGE